MKKITLFLLACLISLGQLSAQQGSSRPEFSTDDTGPWYFIKVIGTDDVRRDRVIVAIDDNDPTLVDIIGTTPNPILGKISTFSQPFSTQTSEYTDQQLWRFEEVDPVAGTVRIINKATGLKMDQTLLEGHVSGNNTVVLSEEPTTDFIIMDERSGSRTDVFHLVAANPLNPDMPSFHMGNQGFNYRVVFEGDTYGYGGNSQFYFQKYEAGFLIDVATVDFGTVLDTHDGDNVYKEFHIDALFDITGSYTAEYDNTDFQVELEETTSGNALGIVYFYPSRGVGEYSTEVTIKNTTSAGPVERKLMLKGIVRPSIPVTPSPTIAPSADDKWYSIRFSQRTGYYLKDMGANEKIEVYPGIDQDEETQLWKFVPNAENERAFHVVSQSGNLLDHQFVEEEGTDGLLETKSYFYTSADSDDTFSFVIKNDTEYLLQWNEYETAVIDPDTGEETMQPTPTYVYKIRDNDYLNHNTTANAAEATVLFYEKGSADYVKTNFPLFSNGDQETYYYIRFQRKLPAGDTLTAINNAGIGQLVGQAPVEDEADPFFLWKFVGTWDNFKIVGKFDQGEMGPLLENLATSTFLEDSGIGASYKMWGFNNTADFQLECRSDMTHNYRYMNDFGGAASVTIGGYVASDGGNRVYFTKEGEFSWKVGIETPEISVDDDQVISSVYYTIQGIQLGTAKPTAPGFYIEKNIHESNKVSTRTFYIVK